ncbi:hypothetical protein OEZ86_002704 [Tetradesmus obliquus]|nr:hypothetical protein OEZ86_002704 [Tetradesmus obliquus]
MAHEKWLKQELMKALSWDDMIVDGVVDVISKASSADDEHVQDIVQNFMENSPVAISIIADYMDAKRGNTKQQQQQQQQQQHRQPGALRQATPVLAPAPQQQQQQQQQQQRASYSTSVAAAPKPSPAQRAAAVKQEQDKWLNLGGKQQPQLAEQAGDAAKTAEAGKSSAKQSAEATLSMFKRGGRIQARPKPGEAAAAGSAGSSSSGGQSGGQRKGPVSQLEQLTGGLERKVANCLSCGKIFDCRSLTNDIIAFIHGKFACTYCGAQVAMTQQQRIAQAQQPPHSSSSTEAAGDAGSAAAAEDDATAKAIAFKDRLVDYDRHSQKRTTVIDDQSDYFEIDTNAWLSEEERAELKRRAEAEEAAAAARRNRVVVTLDLLGRKVLMTEGPDGAAAGGSSDGASFQTMSATEALRQGVDVTAAAGGAAAAAGGTAAAAGGGGGAAGAAGAADDQGVAAAEALQQALAAIRDLRISLEQCSGCALK